MEYITPVCKSTAFFVGAYSPSRNFPLTTVRNMVKWWSNDGAKSGPPRPSERGQCEPSRVPPDKPLPSLPGTTGA